MCYQGDKYRLLHCQENPMKEFIASYWNDGQAFYDLTLGGGSVAGAMGEYHKGPMYLSDLNRYQVALIKAVRAGWVAPFVSRELYNEIRNAWKAGDVSGYSPELVAWAMMYCSMMGYWAHSYTPYGWDDTRPLDHCRHQAGEYRSLVKRISPIPKRARISLSDMFEMKFKSKSLIYADIPYKATEQYKGAEAQFEWDRFWEFARQWTRLGHTVLVSEVNAPSDFVVAWERVIKTAPRPGLPNGKTRHEKVFMHESANIKRCIVMPETLRVNLVA